MSAQIYRQITSCYSKAGDVLPVASVTEFADTDEQQVDANFFPQPPASSVSANNVAVCDDSIVVSLKELDAEKRIAEEMVAQFLEEKDKN